MPEIIRSISDIEKKAARSRERHERLRAERLSQIVSSIERAMLEGAEEISAVLQSLSESERKDLYDHFPTFLTSLQSASSLEELMAITRGVSALKSRVAAAADRAAGDHHLARHALAFAKAPNANRCDVVADLALVENPPSSLAGVVGLWIRIQYRVLVRRVWRRT